MSEGSFPEKISLGSRAVGWLASEIHQWLDERISSRKLKNE
jgi:prophage regulatory protein